jgi:hypothetical protein
MAEPCFKMNSPPPLWCPQFAAHRASKFENSLDSMLGDFAYFVCPVSGDVVRDSPPQKRSPD